ncbi:MAG: type secretion/conjugal transfer ATPase, VirB4 family [Candidatus Sulfotelmatobacter sp.]|nr:type secretion/conjugal transfer ATPase, VirB4 family [Candidatus Sulfotelmatobacter sp.]
MLRLARALTPYRESGSLNEHINLFGFIDEHTFLTKSGDVGMVLAVRGVDYECLDASGIDNCTKRLEAALKLFDGRCRIYQYLFKRNAPELPHRAYSNPIVSAAINNRITYLKGKAESLYALAIYFVVIFENSPANKALLRTFAKSGPQKRRAWRELKAALSNRKQAFLLGDEIHRAQAALSQKISSFILQVNDFLPVELLGKREAFRFLKQVLNFAPHKLEFAQLKHDTFLDYYLCESQLECHRGFLRIDDFYVKVLTLKEPSGQSFPLMFQKLLEVRANFFIVTEWKKEEPDKTRARIHSRRRHFHNTKRSLISYMNTSDTPASVQDILVDDSKEAQIQSLGQALKELEVNGNYFGEFSLTVVTYDLDLTKVEAACAEFYKVFSVHDAQLYDERCNLLNAYLATVPGNSAFNLRRLYLTSANYADYSFLFTLHAGESENLHLKQEYLAVLETSHQTPYFLNLHHRDIAHTVILGRTGSGKSFLLNFLITNLQKYEPYTFIFDLGGSFGSLTRLFQGSYLRVGLESHDFKINPFALPPSKRNLDFLSVFVRVLAESQGAEGISSMQERELFEQIQNLYELDDPALHTLSTLGNTLRRGLDNRLHKWKQGGQFGFLFDNPEDNISFSRFQCFDFQGMREYPQLLEPLLFYVLHRADAIIRDPEISHVFKAFFIDEAWVFLKNPSVRSYIIEALKTWRKHNAALVLSTQSLDELRKSEILDVILESCVTKIFLANPDMDRELYQRQFHLNDHEIELITGLVPKQQMLIKTPDTSKVANLNVDARSYWLYTNDPFDNRQRDDAFAAYGFEKGLEVLASSRSVSKDIRTLSGD